MQNSYADTYNIQDIYAMCIIVVRLSASHYILAYIADTIRHLIPKVTLSLESLHWHSESKFPDVAGDFTTVYVYNSASPVSSQKGGPRTQTSIFALYTYTVEVVGRQAHIDTC